MYVHILEHISRVQTEQSS